MIDCKDEEKGMGDGLHQAKTASLRMSTLLSRTANDERRAWRHIGD